MKHQVLGSAYFLIFYLSIRLCIPQDWSKALEKKCSKMSYAHMRMHSSCKGREGSLTLIKHNFSYIYYSETNAHETRTAFSQARREHTKLQYWDRHTARLALGESEAAHGHKNTTAGDCVKICLHPSTT